MKNLTNIILGFIISGALLLAGGCSKTGPEGPTGPAGPTLVGSITGYVLLSDQYGAPITTGFSTARIILYNAAGIVVDSVNANSAGVYTINNVVTGNYTMICRDSGFGLAEHQNIEFTGNSTTIDNKLSQIPNFNVTSANDSVGVKVLDVYIYGSIPADAKERTLLVFIGNGTNTSSAPATYSSIFTQLVAPNATTYLMKIPLSNIYGDGFASGTTVYFAIYGATNNYTDGDYTDFASGHLVYTPITLQAFTPLPSAVLP